jgi:3-dehydroquinate synthase
MRRLNVALGQRSYPILIGPNALAQTEEITKVLSNRNKPRVALVTNETVAQHYLNQFTSTLVSIGVEPTLIVLPDGEQFKTWESLNQIHGAMLDARCDRRTVVMALGGGVIGDLAGFAAATYQRGVPFVQIPTTLLSQVDSSVGGKTGINHARGKNMVGAFWQPSLVLADTTVLKTLSEREFASGLAEVIKYGLIQDLPFFDWLEQNFDALMRRDGDALAYAIERSCQNKAAVVEADELETAAEGGRALLNLGHTFGHAIETGVGYGRWLHGEAVAAGTIMAAHLSMRLGWIGEESVGRIKSLYDRAKLPLFGPALGASVYLDLMSHDKKVMDGRLRLVLLKEIGNAVTYSSASQADLYATIEANCAN